MFPYITYKYEFWTIICYDTILKSTCGPTIVTNQLKVVICLYHPHRNMWYLVQKIDAITTFQVIILLLIIQYSDTIYQ
jgi:hypothetical protein